MSRNPPSQHITVVDWQQPSNNDYVVTTEMELKTGAQREPRLDVVCARRVDDIVDKNATFPEWAERDDVLRDIRKDTIKLLLVDDATKSLVSSGFIDEVLQVATAREGAAT